jgi:hypothetical protein
MKSIFLHFSFIFLSASFIIYYTWTNQSMKTRNAWDQGFFRFDSSSVSTTSSWRPQPYVAVNMVQFEDSKQSVHQRSIQRRRRKKLFFRFDFLRWKINSIIKWQVIILKFMSVVVLHWVWVAKYKESTAIHIRSHPQPPWVLLIYSSLILTNHRYLHVNPPTQEVLFLFCISMAFEVNVLLFWA